MRRINPLIWKIPFPTPLHWKLQRPSLDFLFKATLRNPVMIRQSFGAWLMWFLVLSLIVSSIGIFFVYVDPSLTGATNLRIGPDSTFYLWYAGLVRDNPYGANSDPTIALVSLGSNYFGPVLLAQVLRNNFLILCFNYSLFGLSIWYLAKSTPLRVALLTFVLIFNPLILVSILTLNKEILAVLSTAMLCRYVSSESRSKLLLAGMLVISLLSRWQHLVAVCLFLLLIARRSPFRSRRKLAIALIVIAITLIYPTVADFVSITAFGSEELKGNTIAALTAMQAHYLFFLSALPKVALAFVGGLTVPFLQEQEASDVYNRVIVPLGSVFNLVMLVWFFFSRRLRLADDMILFAVVYAVLFAISPIAQVRYLIPIYVVICREVCALDASLSAPKKAWLPATSYGAAN